MSRKLRIEYAGAISLSSCPPAKLPNRYVNWRWRGSRDDAGLDIAGGGVILRL